MIEYAKNDDVKLTKTSIGRIISDVWGNTVVKIANKGRYKNLSYKEAVDVRLILNLKAENIDMTQLENVLQSLITVSFPAWNINFIANHSKLFLTKKLSEILVEEQRMEIEIEVAPCPVNIVVRVHGNSLPLNEMGIWNANCVNLKTLLMVFDVSPVCIGFPVEHSVSLFDTHEQKQSKISAICESGVCTTRMISMKCSLIAKSMQGTCDECSYLNKLYNGKIQRMVDTPSKFCNDRYLDNDGLKHKAYVKTRELKNALIQNERVQKKLTDTVVLSK